MPTIKRLSFIGLEYAFAPEKAYGMSRGGGFRRQSGLFDFDHIEARVRNAMYHLGVGNQLTACLAAINVALFDAMARDFGVRVCDLIGGCGTTRIPAYASTGFFSDDPDRQLDHMLAEAASHPYAGAKIKIGRGIRDDIARVRRAREALGPEKLLMVDINGAYTAD